uniref:Uncharacterized protein n=1 Tax=Diadromus pulchellus ascovirus 4a TaxID=158683 RepID=Q9DSW0_9VIRU|nr:hypothetical protein [Diadromus pulchellus ascovirus 4a]
MRQRTNLYIICGMLAAVTGVGVRAASIRQPGLYLRASVCGRSGVDPGQIFATTKDLQGEENRYIELLQPPPSHVRDSSHGDIRVLPIFRYGVDLAAFLITTTSGLLLELMLLGLFVVYPAELERTVETLHM